jgi:hypothetical protein
MKKLLLIITILFLSTSVYSQIKAVTEKGDTINVFKNGTWTVFSQKENVKVDVNQSNKELEKIITIKAINLGNPNSASGVGFGIQWKNTSNKIIKYIFFEALPYNAVGDIVNGEISRSSYFRGKVTGPIKQEKRKISSWSTAWYNRTIKRIEIVKIDIEYLDGSKIELFADDIKKILLN